jgi:hypothetical protein
MFVSEECFVLFIIEQTLGPFSKKELWDDLTAFLTFLRASDDVLEVENTVVMFLTCYVFF